MATNFAFLWNMKEAKRISKDYSTAETLLKISSFLPKNQRHSQQDHRTAFLEKLYTKLYSFIDYVSKFTRLSLIRPSIWMGALLSHSPCLLHNLLDQRQEKRSRVDCKGSMSSDCNFIASPDLRPPYTTSLVAWILVGWFSVSIRMKLKSLERVKGE